MRCEFYWLLFLNQYWHSLRVHTHKHIPILYWSWNMPCLFVPDFLDLVFCYYWCFSYIVTCFVILTEFHTMCVDAWLTSWRTFCPVCKRDARTSTGDPPASESTPLLSSSASLASLSSVRSSLASSSAIQIGPSSSRPPSRPQSISSTPYTHRHSLQSYIQSPHLTASRSSVDLRNASSQRSRASYLVSPHSLGYPSISPLNSRYMSPYIPSPGNASSYIGSSSRQPNPLRQSESYTSFSPFASAQSLPGCE